MRDALGPVVFGKEKFALHFTRTHRGLAAGHAASWVVRHLPSLVVLSELLYTGHVVGMDRDVLSPMACPSQHLGGAVEAEVFHVDFLEPPPLAPVAATLPAVPSEWAGDASSRSRASVQDMAVACFVWQAYDFS